MARLFFEQIAVHGTGPHHDDFLFDGAALGGSYFILPFNGFDLGIQGNQPYIAALARGKVITEIANEANHNHGDQITPKNIALLDKTFHAFQ